MIAPIVYLSTPSETATYQLAPVGTIRAYDHPDFGYQLLRSVKATSAITKYELCQYDAGSSETVVKSTTDKQKAINCAGFATASIAAGSYGWVVCSGQAYALGHSSMSAGASILSATTAGRVDNPAVGSGESLAVLGSCVSVTGWASAGDTITIRVSNLV